MVKVAETIKNLKKHIERRRLHLRKEVYDGEAELKELESSLVALVHRQNELVIEEYERNHKDTD